MEVEKHYMSRKSWKRVIDRKYVVDSFNENGLIGKASLIHIKKVTSPSIKNMNRNNVVIANDNFFWLQIGLENKNYWITAMYDDNKRLIQYYIDITKRNHVSNEDDPYFEDLFLDVVFLEDEVIVLDEDELEIALLEKKITKDDYELAYNMLGKIQENTDEFKVFLDRICNRFFDYLIKNMVEE